MCFLGRFKFKALLLLFTYRGRVPVNYMKLQFILYRVIAFLATRKALQYGVNKPNAYWYLYRVFSHDVTAAIPKTMKRRPCSCPKPVLWELNSFLMQTLSFVSMNLHRCWPREWKHSIKCCHYYKGLMLLCFRRRVYWPIMVTLFSTFGSCTIRQAENIIFVSSKGFNCVKDDLKYNLILMILHIDPTII